MACSLNPRACNLRNNSVAECSRRASKFMATRRMSGKESAVTFRLMHPLFRFLLLVRASLCLDQSTVFLGSCFQFLVPFQDVHARKSANCLCLDRYVDFYN